MLPDGIGGSLFFVDSCRVEWRLSSGCFALIGVMNATFRHKHMYIGYE